MLRVLHINASDIDGGAAASAWKLHVGLSGIGHQSRMLVGRKLSEDESVRPLKRSTAWRVADRAIGAVLDAVSLPQVVTMSAFGVLRDPWFIESDVVQLHNLHGSYFGFAALPALTRTRPTVWLLHDMWPITGHTAYAYECERWRTGCGSCPHLAEYPALSRDTSALLWRIKRSVYARSRLTIVAPSQWLARAAAESPLLGGFQIEHIPYAVDLDRFSPGDRQEARTRLGLPGGRKVVLFVAADAGEPRKGLASLEDAIARLADPPLLVVAGRPPARSLRVEMISLGQLGAESDIRDAYRAADVVAIPSLADNLPNVALEAMACGVPIVAFATGGLPELVRTGQSGELVPTGDSNALAGALERLLGDEARCAELSRSTRRLAEDGYGLDRQARRYADLYSQLVEPP